MSGWPRMATFFGRVESRKNFIHFQQWELIGINWNTSETRGLKMGRSPINFLVSSNFRHEIAALACHFGTNKIPVFEGSPMFTLSLTTLQ